MVFRRDKLAHAGGGGKVKAGHVLIVDDEPDNLRVLEDLLSDEYIVHKTESAMDGLRVLEHQPIAMIITDQRMPEMTGVEFLAQSLYSRPDCIKIVLTGYSDIEATVAAINRGKAHAFLRKPWDTRELLIAVRSGFDTWRMQERQRVLGAVAREATAKLRVALAAINRGLSADEFDETMESARAVLEDLARAAEEPAPANEP